MLLQRKFIVASVPVVTIALLMLGGIVYSKLVESRQESLEREISLAADRIDLRVESIIQEMRISSTLLADAAPLVNWFAKSESHFFGPRIRAEVRSLFEKIRMVRPEFREIRLVNFSGIEQVWVADSSLENLSKNERGSEWFSNVTSNPQAMHHETIASHRDDGVTTVTVSSPVYEQFSLTQGEMRIVGHVAMDMPISAIAKNLDNTAMGSNGFVIFFNEQLDIVHAPDEHTKDADILRNFLISTNHPMDYEGKIEHIKINGQPCIISQNIVKDGLVAIIVSPDSTLQMNKTEIASAVGMVTLSAIVGFSLFFSWLVHWIVVAPVNRLQSGVTKLSQGQHVPAQQSTRKDEIGQLARSFDRMSEQLLISMQHLKKTSLHNERLAYHDGLTGLPNRRLFEDILNNCLDHAAASNNDLALMFIDLDRFKQLNDTEGHQAGDDLLITTAERLQLSCEQLTSDYAESNPKLSFDVARLAGDEFVVLVSGFDVKELIINVADRMKAVLCQNAVIANIEWPLQASIGIALYPEHANDADELLACADRAMYQAKREKNTRWCLYDRSMAGKKNNSNLDKAA